METVGDNDLPKNGDVAKSPFQTVVAVVPSAARGAVRERADDPIRLCDGEPGDLLSGEPQLAGHVLPR
jgi:hypothetical protein